MATLFLIVIYAAFISLGLPDGLLGAAWPVMHQEIDVSISLAGIISMIISGGTIISSLLSSRILVRFGTGRVTLVSVSMTAIALLGYAYSDHFVWLVLLGIPLGLGAGAVDTGLNDYVARHYAARHMSWLHCFWGVGAMSGPLIISRFISNGESWRNGYFTVAAIQFALIVVLFITLPLWERIGSHTTPSTLQPETKAPTQSKSLFFALFVPGVRPVLLAFLFYCGLEATIGLWGSSYLINVRGWDAAEGAAGVSLYFGSLTLGRFISGFITMHLSSKLLIRLSIGLIAIGIVLLVLPLSATAAHISLAMIGLGSAAIFPLMIHETPRRFGAEDAPYIIGFQMATAYVGTTFLPPVFGFVASQTGFILLPVFLGLYTVLMILSTEQANRFLAARGIH